MKILGIHDGHNGTAALMVDGTIVAAISEERLTRRKNEMGFPEKAAWECLRLGNVDPGDLDAVAFSTINYGNLNWLKIRREFHFTIRDWLDDAEAEFFRRLNEVVIPAAKLGLGSPGPLPSGLVLLDTVGRKTGKVYPVPVFATQLGGFLLVATFRARSQWIRNLASAGEVDYWLDGRRLRAKCHVFAPGLSIRGDTSKLPRNLRLPVSILERVVAATGGSFVLLGKTRDRRAERVR